VGEVLSAEAPGVAAAPECQAGDSSIPAGQTDPIDRRVYYGLGQDTQNAGGSFTLVRGPFGQVR
jgi:hypothetical protein